MYLSGLFLTIVSLLYHTMSSRLINAVGLEQCLETAFPKEVVKEHLVSKCQFYLGIGLPILERQLWR